jgi:hypothetical protein
VHSALVLPIGVLVYFVVVSIQWPDVVGIGKETRDGPRGILKTVSAMVANSSIGL